MLKIKNIKNISIKIYENEFVVNNKNGEVIFKVQTDSNFCIIPDGDYSITDNLSNIDCDVLKIAKIHSFDFKNNYIYCDILLLKDNGGC